MRLNGIRCDGCGKEHLFAPGLMIQSVRGELPDDWFIVEQGKWKPDTEPWLFCSKDCLRSHPLTKEESK